MSAAGKNKKIKNINLLLPKKLVRLKLDNKQRLYFLAGPIRGADDWHAKAIKLIAEKDSNCYIACPSRYDDKHKLYRYAVHLRKEVYSDDSFPNQTLWERYYLELASYYGAIIFWLPLESKNNPRKKEDGPYARDTLGEIGRWSTRSANKLGLKKDGQHKKRVNLVIGAHKDFPGLKVIKKNLDADHAKEFLISNKLSHVIDKAIILAKKYTK